jgi:ubiquitin-protein ligase
MAILEDDWSPYLTLAAVIDSLDSILEEPDKEYAATSELRHEYLNDPKKYATKIEQTIKAYSSVMMVDNEESVA